MANDRGFERIQLLVILGIAALALMILVPALVRKTRSARELRVKALLRNFHAANEVYRSRHPDEGYAPELRRLVVNPEKIAYLEKFWLQPEIAGYRATYQSGAAPLRQTYALRMEEKPLLGSPAAPNRFCMDQQGILRQAGASSALLVVDAGGCAGGIEVV